MHDRWTACNVISAQGYNNKSSYLSILFNVFVPDGDRAAPAPVPFACKGEDMVSAANTTWCSYYGECTILS